MSMVGGCGAGGIVLGGGDSMVLPFLLLGTSSFGLEYGLGE